MSPPPDVPRPGHGGHGAGPHDGLPALVHRQARHLAHQQAQEAAPQGRAGNEPSRSLEFHSQGGGQSRAFSVILKSSRNFVSSSGSRGRITRRGAMASGARMWRKPTESRTKISREQWSRDRWSQPEIHFFIKTTFRFLPRANDFYLVGAKLKLNEFYPSSSGWRIKWQFVKQTSHRICQTFRLKGFPHQMRQPARKHSEDVLRILRLQSKGHCGN